MQSFEAMKEAGVDFSIYAISSTSPSPSSSTLLSELFNDRDNIDSNVVGVLRLIKEGLKGRRIGDPNPVLTSFFASVNFSTNASAALHLLFEIGNPSTDGADNRSLDLSEMRTASDDGEVNRSISQNISYDIQIRYLIEKEKMAWLKDFLEVYAIKPARIDLGGKDYDGLTIEDPYVDGDYYYHNRYHTQMCSELTELGFELNVCKHCGIWIKDDPTSQPPCNYHPEFAITEGVCAILYEENIFPGMPWLTHVFVAFLINTSSSSPCPLGFLLLSPSLFFFFVRLFGSTTFSPPPLLLFLPRVFIATPPYCLLHLILLRPALFYLTDLRP